MVILTWLEQFLKDIRFGVRNLVKNPGFAAIAIASLAVGIGASAAMYSVIYAVIIQPFPYKDVDHLMSVQLAAPDQPGGSSYYTVDQFAEIAGRNQVFSGTIASTWDDVTWTGEGDPQRLRGNHCTFNTFDVMGVPPQIGRVPGAADETPGAEPVVVLGYKFWQRQFAGDKAVLGRRLQLNGVIRTVIGVMPRPFMWRGADVYLPVHYRAGETPEEVRNVHLMGRLRAGVSAESAAAQLRPIIDELQRQNPRNFPRDYRILLRNFKETFPASRSITEALWILFGAVGVLFLIACVNVSNLLLSRAMYRRNEMAIRASMGASRVRLIRQLLSESLVLAVSGGALGIGLAYAGIRAIIVLVPPNTIPDEAVIAINAPVLIFTAAVAMLAALLFGLAPALHLAGRDILTPLKEGGRGSAGSRLQRILHGGLVAGEVALSLVLLVGAGLMMRSMFWVTGSDLGIPADRILTMSVPFSQQNYPNASRRLAFLQEVKRRLATVPGLRGAAVCSSYHPAGGGGVSVVTPGNTQPDTRSVTLFQTSEGYLNAMGIPLVSGRFFNEQEVDARLQLAVVNESFVRRFFNGQSPLGQTVRLPSLLRRPPAGASAQPAAAAGVLSITDDAFQIIGVVRDTMNRVMTNETVPEVYIPYSLLGTGRQIVAQGLGKADTIERSVRAQVYAVDGTQPVMDVRTLDSLLDDRVYAQPRFNFFLFSVFASIGLTLSLCGIYGVISNSVARRTREIGIRMALGANFQQVLAMVIGQGARLMGIGIAVGLAASLAAGRYLSYLKSMLRHVSAFDPYSFTAVSVLLFAAGIFACFWPARRAARVDPLNALREN